ncbi:NADH-quinone oxidoreductase subunit D-related protein [Litchfieldella rifensis]|uniref:NADH-quinone oxidoreductase subunit D domain-containing protein n=1 Tax=Litchfieldella rifensis TaxID=762643 RepID=A0ABV7LRN3_9GAMM
MAVNGLRLLAARSSVPVFPALGVHGEAALHRLALTPGIELVDSPRHASVLLVAGGVPPDHFEALRRVHDQLPKPFATLWFHSEPLPDLENATRIDDIEALPDALVTLHRELMSGQRGSSPRLLPDRPPNPWEGLGDDGHGGEGMMGGVPYGRPMAMNMNDDIRDGLTLDSLTFRLGPFLPALPPGMVVEITLQGDLIQTWSTQSTPYPQGLDPVFFATRERPVPIAELELARVRHHLHRLFHGLRLAGLEAASLHALRLARELTPNSSLDGLRRRLVHGGFFAILTAGRGVLDGEQARQLGGPVARAAGVEDDLRSRDANYRLLGFTPLCRQGGDTRSRWEQLLAEIEQSLQLACRAARDDVPTSEAGRVETPHGPWPGNQQPEKGRWFLDDLMPGLEWDEALACLASLDVAPVSEWPLTERKGRRT